MVRIFLLHNLAPGVSHEQYEREAASKYIPMLRSFGSICDFKLYRSLGAPPGTAPYAYVGIIDVESIASYEADRQTATYCRLEQDWAKQIADTILVVGEELQI